MEWMLKTFKSVRSTGRIGDKLLKGYQELPTRIRVLCQLVCSRPRNLCTLIPIHILRVLLLGLADISLEAGP
jgi:hypothetical protein